MDRKWLLGWIGFLSVVLSSVSATLTINEISGPESIELGTQDEFVLDCDFTASADEDGVVLKWFFNGSEQIYQWILQDTHAYAMGPLKDVIDNNYTISDDPRTMFRALKLKEVKPELSGNYTCRVESTNSTQDVMQVKQVVIYSPATSFVMYLIGADDDIPGNEVVMCAAENVLPKPEFNLYIAGFNDSLKEPKIFNESKETTSDDSGAFNVTITLSFNESYLEPGTTRFVCLLEIPGTNYSEVKRVDNFVGGGKSPISPSLFLVLLVMGSLVFAT